MGILAFISYKAFQRQLSMYKMVGFGMEALDERLNICSITAVRILKSVNGGQTFHCCLLIFLPK